MTRNALRGCATLFIGSLLGSPAWGAFCLEGHPSVNQEYRAAYAVAIVEPDRIREHVIKDIRDGRHASYEYGRIQRFVFIRRIKGIGPRRMSMFDTYDSARFSMKIGHRYLVFIHRDDDGRTYIDSCGNSGELPTVENTLRDVDLLAARADGG
jgi:hypothetical protein